MEPYDGGGWSPKPSVSKDKWLEHAIRKLAAGYVLVVNDAKSNANFYKSGAGYESCSYRTAHTLIQTGTVVVYAENDQEKRYRLSENVALPSGPKPGT